MILYKFKSKLLSINDLWREIWSLVWNISEMSGISLGKYGEWVFRQMITKTGYKKIENEIPKTWQTKKET